MASFSPRQPPPSKKTQHFFLSSLMASPSPRTTKLLGTGNKIKSSNKPTTVSSSSGTSILVGGGGILSNSTSPSSRPLDPDDVITFEFKPAPINPAVELTTTTSSLPPIINHASKQQALTGRGGTSKIYKPGSSEGAQSARRSDSIISILPHQKLNSAAMASVAARASHDQKVCVFDVNSGNIHISNNRDVDRSRLVTKLYQQLQNNESLKKQFTQVAAQLPLSRRKELANETLERFHQNKQKAMLARKMLPEAVSRHRANILKHLEIDRCFGDLSKDTSELAAVRISSAAVDALLYHEAQKVADAQLKQQRSLILPEGVRPVDVLEMRLDAWRRQNVPFGVRTLVQ
jgi:hypothetical protein